MSDNYQPYLLFIVEVYVFSVVSATLFSSNRQRFELNDQTKAQKSHK